MDRTKMQGNRVPAPEGLPEGTAFSSDTRRAQLLPPHQSRTRKWPAIDGSGAPAPIRRPRHFQIRELVGKEVEWNWDEFVKLPRVSFFSDIHCVTR